MNHKLGIPPWLLPRRPTAIAHVEFRRRTATGHNHISGLALRCNQRQRGQFDTKNWRCKHATTTVVAEILTELIRLGPEICISNGNKLEFKGKSVSVMKDFLLTFPQICFCNGNHFFWQHDSASVIGN